MPLMQRLLFDSVDMHFMDHKDKHSSYGQCIDREWIFKSMDCYPRLLPTNVIYGATGHIRRNLGKENAM
jgi:hypothetical protein